MTLKSQIADDVTDVFLNADEFGESFIYHPEQGSARTITGTVADERIDMVRTAKGQTEAHILDVLFDNDATTGIDSPRRGEAIERSSESEPRREFKIDSVISSDDAAFVIRLQRPKYHRGGHSPARAFTQ